MTPTALRSAPGRRTQTSGSTHHGTQARFAIALRYSAGRARRALAQRVRSHLGAGAMWSLMLPSCCTNNSTEDAMPDPDAGPSHQPGARILGGPS